MKVLLTGAAGFIGGHIRSRIADENDIEVVALDRVKPRSARPTEAWERCDILDYTALEQVFRWHRPDAVVHAAAQARVEPSVVDPVDTYRLNVEAAINIMRASQATGVGHAIYLSSEQIYGAARIYPTPEVADFNPMNPYAASKIAGDVLFQQLNAKLPTCVLRSGMGWGPAQDHKSQIVAKFITNALMDKPILFPAGEVKHPTRDLNNVQDFSDGLLLALRKRARGVYNLSGGREFSVLQIAERIVDTVGSGSIEFTDKFTYRPNEEGFRTCLSIEKAQRELGYQPRRYFDGPALGGVVDWYREHSEFWQSPIQLAAPLVRA